MACSLLEMRVSNVSLFSCTRLSHFIICSLCVLVLFLPPKQQAADEDRGRDGVPRARRLLMLELRVLSSLTPSVLPVTVSDPLWTLPTALYDARAREICPR